MELSEGIDLDIDLEFWSPEAFFADRLEVFRAVSESKEVYGSLDPDTQEAVASMVQRALFLAADTVQEWLPSAFLVEELDQALVIQLKLLNSQVRAEIADRKKYTSQRIHGIKEDLRQDLEDLGDL